MVCSGAVAKPAGYYFKSTLKVVATGLTAFCGIEFLTGGEKFHRRFFMPLIHKIFDPEQAHRLAVLAAKYRILPLFGSNYHKYPELEIEFLGQTLENCLGLAAGFDKDADALPGLLGSGLGLIEIGSITPEPQPGNEKPRVFRVAQFEAVINRYGFNSAGHIAVEQRLKALKHNHHQQQQQQQRRPGDNKKPKIGINLGKNKLSLEPGQDYAMGYSRLAPFSDYVVINVSSPNTPGLRDLQAAQALKRLLSDVNEVRGRLKDQARPLLLKISPDLNDHDMKAIADVCLDRQYGVDGLIVGNTTISRPVDVSKVDALTSKILGQSGGLSGHPLNELSTRCVRRMRQLTQGKITIVACGGVSCGKDAYEKIRAGATVVQFYTALIYQGFPVIGRIKRELVECLKNDGFTNVQQAIGVDCPV